MKMLENIIDLSYWSLILFAAYKFKDSRKILDLICLLAP
jgi:hypothetical protein